MFDAVAPDRTRKSKDPQFRRLLKTPPQLSSIQQIRKSWMAQFLRKSAFLHIPGGGDVFLNNRRLALWVRLGRPFRVHCTFRSHLQATCRRFASWSMLEQTGGRPLDTSESKCMRQDMINIARFLGVSIEACIEGKRQRGGVHGRETCS